MSEETTGRLDKILQGIKNQEEAEKFAKDHALSDRTFFEYINDYIGRHGIIVSEMIERSGISKNYIYNILNGVTKNPGRDKILAICIASQMTLEEINRGLTASGNNRLYPKNERDIFIATCINQGMHDVTKINIELERRGIPILEV